jgi:hypothetical protein
MKNLVFVGGGGFFLELFEYIQTDIDNRVLDNVQISGFIDDTPDLRHDFCKYLGTIQQYQPKKYDTLLITIGNAHMREKIYEKFMDHACDFYTYIHSSAIISSTATIGKGCIICPFSIVNAFAIIEDNAVVNVHGSIGHKSKIGQSSVLSPYAIVNGNARLGKMSFMGTRATIFPRISVGNMVTIDSHSYAKSDTEDKMFVSSRSKYLAIKNRFIL